MVKCIRCDEEIKEMDAYLDTTGQFPKLNMKAKEVNKKLIILCSDCYSDLSEMPMGCLINYQPSKLISEYLEHFVCNKVINIDEN